jgi:hypothetical protein
MFQLVQWLIIVVLGAVFPTLWSPADPNRYIVLEVVHIFVGLYFFNKIVNTNIYFQLSTPALNQ